MSADRVTCCSVSVTSCLVCSLTTAVWKTGLGLMRTWKENKRNLQRPVKQQLPTLLTASAAPSDELKQPFINTNNHATIFISNSDVAIQELLMEGQKLDVSTIHPVILGIYLTSLLTNSLANKLSHILNHGRFYNS